MTSPTGTRERGATLLELIVVLGLLAGMSALAVPRLSSFMAGQGLRDECARFIALSRHARSEAISRGAPAELWLDAAGGTYGLQYGPPGESGRRPPVTFKLGKGLSLHFEVETPAEEGIVHIAFAPDGTLDAAALERFWIMRGEADGFQLALDASRARYEMLGVNENLNHESEPATTTQ